MRTSPQWHGGYKELHGVTVKQQNAIDRLVAGHTDEQAALAASVHPQIAHITHKLPQVFETVAKRAQCA